MRNSSSCPGVCETTLLLLWMLAGSDQIRAQVASYDFTGPPAATLTHEFGSIHAVHPLSGGRLAVLDRVEQDILVVDLGSGRVAPAARKGSGPGEYRNPGWLSSGPGGGLTTFDMGLQVLHRLSGEGRIIESIPTAEAPVLFAVPIGADTLGGIYFRVIEVVARMRGDLAEGSQVPIMRWDSKQKRVDTIARVPPLPLIVSQRRQPGGGMAMASQTPPFPRLTAVGLRPEGGLILAHPDPYHVQRTDLGGSTTVGPRIIHDVVPVVELDKRLAREADSRPGRSSTGASAGTRTGRPVGVSTQPSSELPWPATKPPFVADPQTLALVPPEGELWLLRSRAAADSIPRYDVIDRFGHRAAVATLRPYSRVVGFGPGVVYTATPDPTTDLVTLGWYRR